MKMRRIAAALITSALLMSMVPSWVIADNEPSANPEEPVEQTETVTDPQEGDPEVPDTDAADPEEGLPGEGSGDEGDRAGDTTATETVSYLYDNGTEWETRTVEAVVLTAEHENELTSGWYVVTESFAHEGRYVVNGSVHLILADNVEFKPRIGITVEEENELSIYAQSTGDDMGRLIVDAIDDIPFGYDSAGAAGIGGGHGHRINMISAGTINIYGGYIYSSGGYEGGAGIGGAGNSNGGTINIHGGHIVARGRGYGSAAAIGAGGSDNGVVAQGADITITGGIIDIEDGYIGDNNPGTSHSTISTLTLDCSRSPDMILRIDVIQAYVTSLNGSTFAAYYDAESGDYLSALQNLKKGMLRGAEFSDARAFELIRKWCQELCDQNEFNLAYQITAAVVDLFNNFDFIILHARIAEVNNDPRTAVSYYKRALSYLRQGSSLRVEVLEAIARIAI